LPVTLTSLPMAPEEVAYNGALAILRDNPILKGAKVKIWELGDGADHTVTATAVPNPSEMPVVRFVFGGYTHGLKTNSHINGILTINLELFTRGLDPRDNFRLFHAVRAALMPAELSDVQANRVAMDPASSHLIRGELRRGAANISPPNKGLYSIKSTCAYDLSFHIKAGV
jgi:hypothetical protein